MQNERCERREDWAQVIVRLKQLFNQFPAKLLRAQAHRCSKCRRKMQREAEEKTPRRRRGSSSTQSVSASVGLGIGIGSVSGSAAARAKQRHSKSLSLATATPASAGEQQQSLPPPPLLEVGETAVDGGCASASASASASYEAHTPFSAGRRSRSARSHARGGAELSGTVRECKHIPKAYFSSAADGNILETLNLSISSTRSLHMRLINDTSVH